MGSFANSLFKIMLGWLQAAVSAVWSAFTSKNGSSLFNWIGKNWILIAGILCIIGLAADLSVYIFRWKPFKVWKRLNSKGTTNSEKPVYQEKSRTRPERQEESEVQPRQSNLSAKNHFRTSADHYSKPDLSQWEEESNSDQMNDSLSVQEPTMITNAGYIVPADSPYRRPATKTTSDEAYVQETVHPINENKTDTRYAPVTTRKRRRISVSELFSDPEEELQSFEAPQQVIDSRKAYREPVYPHGWKKSEDKGE